MVHSGTDLQDMLRLKKAAIELKHLRTRAELDAQIEALQSACATAKKVGIADTLPPAETVLRKLLDVRADACRMFTDALRDLAEQEQILAAGA